MTNYEEQYMKIGMNIFNNGSVDGVCRTGNTTRRLPNQVMRVNPGEETPILQTKEVFWKSAIEEILWIMQLRSNNTKDLRPKIWDKWADEDGSINKSYGYQVAQKVVTKQGDVIVTYENQVKYVLDTLEKDPHDRRCVLTLWNREELAEMNLNPCCHTSTWNLDGGKMNGLLDQRSGDFPVGVPFNTLQYSALLMMFATCLEYPCGNLLHVIADCHIYDNQCDAFQEQIVRYNAAKKGAYVLLDEAKPRLVLNYKKDPNLSAYENFQNIQITDFEMVDYVNLGPLKYALN